MSTSSPEINLIELLPCPFCGNEHPFVEGSFVVTCDNPECQANMVMSPTEAEAVAKWNRRAPRLGSDKGRKS